MGPLPFSGPIRRPRQLASPTTPARTRIRRLARRALRSPLVYWSITAVLVIATARTVARASKPPAELRPAVVVTKGVAAGTPLTSTNTKVVLVPADAIPADSYPNTDAVVGKTSVRNLVVGELVRAAALTRTTRSGLRARIPNGRRALSIPWQRNALALEVGDRIDLLADRTGGPLSPGPLSPDPTPGPTPGHQQQASPVIVHTDLEVIDVADDHITVVVAESQVANIAQSLTGSTVTVVLR